MTMTLPRNGGKPSKATPADKRLKRNRPAPKPSAPPRKAPKAK